MERSRGRNCLCELLQACTYIFVNDDGEDLIIFIIIKTIVVAYVHIIASRPSRGLP